MNKLLLLLFLVSCAHKQTDCTLVNKVTFAGTTISEYHCGDYYKYCKYDANNKQLGCFGKELK